LLQRADDLAWKEGLATAPRIQTTGRAALYLDAGPPTRTPFSDIELQRRAAENS